MPERKTKKKVSKKKVTKKKVTNARGKGDSRTRAARIKEVHREELRKKFKGNEYIRQLELAAKDYDSLYKKVNKRHTTVDRELYKLQLDIIKAKVDLNIKRLKFVLPELKAISFEDGDGKSLTDQFFEAMSNAAKSNNT